VPALAAMQKNRILGVRIPPSFLSMSGYSTPLVTGQHCYIESPSILYCRIFSSRSLILCGVGLLNRTTDWVSCQPPETCLVLVDAHVRDEPPAGCKVVPVLTCCGSLVVIIAACPAQQSFGQRAGIHRYNRFESCPAQQMSDSP